MAEFVVCAAEDLAKVSHGLGSIPNLMSYSVVLCPLSLGTFLPFAWKAHLTPAPFFLVTRREITLLKDKRSAEQ
jgi:hypothetical protein